MGCYGTNVSEWDGSSVGMDSDVKGELVGGRGAVDNVGVGSRAVGAGGVFPAVAVDVGEKVASDGAFQGFGFTWSCLDGGVAGFELEGSVYFGPAFCGFFAGYIFGVGGDGDLAQALFLIEELTTLPAGHGCDQVSVLVTEAHGKAFAYAACVDEEELGRFSQFDRDGLAVGEFVVEGVAGAAAVEQGDLLVEDALLTICDGFSRFRDRTLIDHAFDVGHAGLGLGAFFAVVESDAFQPERRVLQRLNGGTSAACKNPDA